MSFEYAGTRGIVIPCGEICPSSIVLIGLTALTSLILLAYAAFLFKRRSKDPVFQWIRGLAVAFLIIRVISFVVPPEVPYVATFVSARQMSLFLAVFQWHKGVVDSSYKAVKVSLTSPKWIVYYTRLQQALIVTFFPITYSLGAFPGGNPLCSTVQAVNSSYRWFVGMSLAASLSFCNYVVHRAVGGLREQNKKSGGNEGMQRRFKRALRKIRKVTIFIFIVAIIISYTFFNSLIPDGVPSVTCANISSDIIGSVSSGLAAFLILWSTDSAKPMNGSTTSNTKSVSDSGDPRSHSAKSKTYSQIQAERAQTNGGFASPSPAATGRGGFASPSPVATGHGGFASPSPMDSPRQHGFSTSSGGFNSSPPTGGRDSGFTSGPPTGGRDSGFSSGPSRTGTGHHSQAPAEV